MWNVTRHMEVAHAAQMFSCVSQHLEPEAPEGLPCCLLLHGQFRSGLMDQHEPAT